MSGSHSRPRSRRFPRFVAALSSLTLVGVGLAISAAATASTDSTSSQIVTFAAGTTAAEREAALADAGAVQVSSVPQLRMYAVDVDSTGAAALGADASVQSIEADRVRAVEG